MLFFAILKAEWTIRYVSMGVWILYVKLLISIEFYGKRLGRRELGS